MFDLCNNIFKVWINENSNIFCCVCFMIKNSFFVLFVFNLNIYVNSLVCFLKKNNI